MRGIIETLPTFLIRSNKVIRRGISTGRPLGSEEFIRKLEKVLKERAFPEEGRRPK